MTPGAACTTSSATIVATSARRGSIPCASRSAPTAFAMCSSSAPLSSTERDRQNRPWLRRFALDGSLLEDWPIPDVFQPASMPDAQGRNVQTRGVRSNLGFEGVTLAPDEGALYVMNEEALAQDGPIASPAAGTNDRLLRYGLSSGSP